MLSPGPTANIRVSTRHNPYKDKVNQALLSKSGFPLRLRYQIKTRLSRPLCQSADVGFLPLWRATLGDNCGTSTPVGVARDSSVSEEDDDSEGRVMSRTGEGVNKILIK